MTTRKMCRCLHGQRPGGIHGGIGGHPVGTKLSALFDDDTHDVLLFARGTRGLFCGRAVGHRFGTVLSALFDDDTQDVPLFARETRVGGPAGQFVEMWDRGGVNSNKRKDKV